MIKIYVSVQGSMLHIEDLTKPPNQYIRIVNDMQNSFAGYAPSNI